MSMSFPSRVDGIRGGTAVARLIASRWTQDRTPANPSRILVLYGLRYLARKILFILDQVLCVK